MQRRVATVLAEEVRVPADLVFLTCKAFDLESAMEAIAPAIGPATAVLPIRSEAAQCQANVAIILLLSRRSTSSASTNASGT